MLLNQYDTIIVRIYMYLLDGNGWKRMEMDGNGWKWKETDGNGRKRMETDGNEDFRAQSHFPSGPQIPQNRGQEATTGRGASSTFLPVNDHLLSTLQDAWRNPNTLEVYSADIVTHYIMDDCSS